MKLPLGPHRKVWSSLAESTAWMAMMLSPPGRLSITTGWPHFFCSRSWISRAPMSAPAPGPNGMMKRTGRCGQLCACDLHRRGEQNEASENAGGRNAQVSR